MARVTPKIESSVGELSGVTPRVRPILSKAVDKDGTVSLFREEESQLKESITLISGVLLFAMVSAATAEPRYEGISATSMSGPTHFSGRFFNDDLGALRIVNTGFDMHGGGAQFIYNFNHWASGLSMPAV